MEVEYDPGADALSIDLVDSTDYREAYDHTIDVTGDEVSVDVDARGRVLGIEVLFASEGFDLDPVIERFGLEELRPELEKIQRRDYKPDLIWKKTPSV